MFYPPDTFQKLKIGDELDIGFNDLKARIIKKLKIYDFKNNICWNF